MRKNYAVKRGALLALLGALTAVDVSGKSQVLNKYNKISMSQENSEDEKLSKIEIDQSTESFDTQSEGHYSTVVLNGEVYYPYDPNADKRVSSHQEFIKTKPDPYIETYEEHTLPTTAQMGEWIRNKRGITQSEFDIMVANFVKASEEYGISYTEDQAIKVWYLVAVMPLEQKRKYIEERWGMTAEELEISEAIVMAEAKRNSNNTPNYCDSFGVTDTAIGRTKHRTYSKKGGDVYDQFTLIGQFQVYTESSYKKNMGITNYGCLDALCAYAYAKDLGLTPLRIPFYIEFKANSRNLAEGTYIQVTSKGNKYQTNHYMPIWNSVDYYEPYNSLTDSYFHSIMDERELCNIQKLQRVVQPEHW